MWYWLDWKHRVGATADMTFNFSRDLDPSPHDILTVLAWRLLRAYSRPSLARGPAVRATIDCWGNSTWYSESSGNFKRNVRDDVVKQVIRWHGLIRSDMDRSTQPAQKMDPRELKSLANELMTYIPDYTKHHFKNVYYPPKANAAAVKKFFEQGA